MALQRVPGVHALWNVCTSPAHRVIAGSKVVPHLVNDWLVVVGRMRFLHKALLCEDAGAVMIQALVHHFFVGGRAGNTRSLVLADGTAKPRKPVCSAPNGTTSDHAPRVCRPQSCCPRRCVACCRPSEPDPLCRLQLLTAHRPPATCGIACRLAVPLHAPAVPGHLLA